MFENISIKHEFYIFYSNLSWLSTIKKSKPSFILDLKSLLFRFFYKKHVETTLSETINCLNFIPIFNTNLRIQTTTKLQTLCFGANNICSINFLESTHLSTKTCRNHILINNQFFDFTQNIKFFINPFLVLILQSLNFRFNFIFNTWPQIANFDPYYIPNFTFYSNTY